MTEHETLSAALVAALSELTNVAKGHKATVQTNKGRDYEYTYTSIADLVADTRPVLADHGIVALTPIHDHPDGMACTVVLLHSSGERMDFGPFPFPSKGMDAQTTGSWVTYIRRYALLSALGMGAEDDDGSKAVAAQKQEPKANITAAAAKKGVLDRLEKAEIADATDHAAEVWKQMFGDERRPITQTEWDGLCDATDRHIEDLKAMEPQQEDLLEQASAAAREAAKA